MGLRRFLNLSRLGPLSRPGSGVSTESLDLSRISYLGPIPQENIDDKKLGRTFSLAFEVRELESVIWTRKLYQNIRKDDWYCLPGHGDGCQKYPELVRRFFMKAVPPTDHRFAALHGAVWVAVHSFMYPKEPKSLPLQAYFRMNVESSGQFDNMLIIADEGSISSS